MTAAEVPPVVSARRITLLFLVIALSLILSPYRQRLADRISDTIVVNEGSLYALKTVVDK